MAKKAESDDSSPEMHDYYRAIGTRLRAARKAKGWSLKEMSERSGVPLTYIATVERVPTNASIKTLYRLATALEMSVAELLPGGTAKAAIDFESRYRTLKERLLRLTDGLKNEAEMDAASIAAEGKTHH